MKIDVKPSFVTTSTLNPFIKKFNKRRKHTSTLEKECHKCVWSLVVRSMWFFFHLSLSIFLLTQADQLCQQSDKKETKLNVKIATQVSENDNKNDYNATYILLRYGYHRKIIMLIRRTQ